ncbi:hypothetical protein PFLUV_G00146020 [Perca fluviatilis]|uniref:Ig-like domain-containing protein n=1 Tax=Perca fluviatilis TaxID=8168 RepID=A0A6A5F335_PERFL|nr:uncharacterized protein LOC120570223 isoform X1 [Perca fluviatilis]KAF1382654.1 hypothetical protein PFLUV_G00146020 [Perca fluviatilis]
MVIMFNRDQAALLSIQLYVMGQVFAEILSQTDEHRNMLVSRGDPVILICNISKTNATQIIWTKGRSFFAHLVSDNKTVSNFTSHKIDINLPSKLNISNVQHDDAGLYKCDITDRQGRWTIKWNLTVSGEPQDTSKEISPLRSFLYILTAVTGLLLCVFTSAVCLHRKLGARTPNQNPVQEQFDLQSEGEVGVPQPQGVTDSRANYKHGSQYTERLNSIYGL